MRSDPIRWLAAPPSSLHRRVWDGITVVFDERSGDTHLLEPVALATLKCLEGGPATADELFRAVAVMQGLTPEPPLRARFDELMRRLDESGLIEPADDPG